MTDISTHVRVQATYTDADGIKMTSAHECTTQQSSMEIMGIDLAACVDAAWGRGKAVLANAILNYPEKKVGRADRRAKEVMDKIENSTHDEREEKHWNALLAAAQRYASFWEKLDQEMEAGE